MNSTTSVPPKSLSRALAYVRRGGRLCVRTAIRATVIDAKVLANFDKANTWILKEDGESYRLRRGQGSVYILPGQLEAINEEGFNFSSK